MAAIPRGLLAARPAAGYPTPLYAVPPRKEPLMPQRLACLALLLLAPFAFVRAEDSDYKLGPDSMVKPDVPKGKLTKMPPWTSKIFAGTVRDWWIYVPAQYDAAKPASLMVFQDGGSYVNLKGDFRVPTVFDNLIAAKQMPVTIGVFINPGVIPPAPGNKNAKPRRNRSFEYDTLSDQYVRFLEKEILPEVEKTYKLSKNPKDRAICGISSGGICASPRPGSGPTCLARYSVRSAASPTSAAATFILA